MGIINSSRGKLAPASAHLLSEPAIVCRLAEALFETNGSGPSPGAAMPPAQSNGARSTAPRPPGTLIPWGNFAANYDLIRERIARVVPGFENYNTRVREGSFYLPNAVRDGREWRTTTRRANFVVAPIPHHALAQGEFVMMTIRTHDQFNTTIYGLDDRYRGVFGGRRVVFMHEADIAAAGLQQGQLVDLENGFGGTKRVAREFMVAPYRIPRGCVATYFPEANVLVPIDSVAAKSNTPTSKFVIVTIAASGSRPE
jgi:anaerobic selenocysteine-containing dehydrogenase